nr:MAG TPA: hypothetical protein [Caudoviricetes sp.]
MAFSITVTKQLTKTGFRNTVINAIKAANPSLNDLNFNDFDIEVDVTRSVGHNVKYNVDNNRDGAHDGMVVKPTVKMIIKENEDIKRNYTEGSYQTTFTVNSPEAEEFIKKHVVVENLSELTWDDYDAVKKELRKFVSNSYSPIILKEETENNNSKYIYLGFDSSHSSGRNNNDTPSALLSYKYVSSEMDGNFKRVLTFHFTRADNENKRDLRIDNSNLTVGENGMTENYVPSNGPSDEL